MFKSVKQARRKAIRDAVAETDRAVVAATATGAPDRIDDETRGLDLSTSVVRRRSAGTLLKSRACYICKQHYTQVDAFYHQLCPECARVQPREARRPHRPHRQARPAHRRPRQDRHAHRAAAAARRRAHRRSRPAFRGTRCAASPRCPTPREWLHRLRVVGIDLRDPAQVVALADSVAAQGPLDILINNAAQTVRRSPGAYSPARRGRVAAPARRSAARDGDVRSHQRPAPARARGVGGRASAALGRQPRRNRRRARPPGRLTADELAELAMAPGSSSLAKHADGTAIDAGGLVPDVNRGQQLDPGRSGCRPARDARGAALQHHGPVHPDQPPARRRWPPSAGAAASTS